MTRVVWFVEPLDDGFTNGAIAELLSQASLAENATAIRLKARRRSGEICTVNVWRVPDYAFVARMSRGNKYSFRVWRRRGGGLLEEWPFSGKKKFVSKSAARRIAIMKETRPRK